MTLTIPTWLIWTVGLLIGVPATIVVLACAWIGFMFAWNWKGPY